VNEDVGDSTPSPSRIVALPYPPGSGVGGRIEAMVVSLNTEGTDAHAGRDACPYVVDEGIQTCPSHRQRGWSRNSQRNSAAVKGKEGMALVVGLTPSRHDANRSAKARAKAEDVRSIVRVAWHGFVATRECDN
jgi:hypothetical protein